MRLMMILLFPTFAQGFENDAYKTQNNQWVHYQRPMKIDADYEVFLVHSWIDNIESNPSIKGHVDY